MKLWDGRVRGCLRFRRLTFSHISRLAAAAEKYDVPDLSRGLRQTMTSDIYKFPGTFLENYALSCSYGWKEEANFVSQFCPPPSVRLHNEFLMMLDTSSLLKLIGLHQARKEIVTHALSISYQKNIPEETRLKNLRWEFLGNHPNSECRSQHHDKGLWHLLKCHLISELERSAPIETKDKLGEGGPFWSESRLTPIWCEECTKCSKTFLMFSQD